MSMSVVRTRPSRKSVSTGTPSSRRGFLASSRKDSLMKKSSAMVFAAEVCVARKSRMWECMFAAIRRAAFCSFASMTFEREWMETAVVARKQRKMAARERMRILFRESAFALSIANVSRLSNQ